MKGTSIVNFSGRALVLAVVVLVMGPMASAEPNGLCGLRTTVDSRQGERHTKTLIGLDNNDEIVSVILGYGGKQDACHTVGRYGEVVSLPEGLTLPRGFVASRVLKF